MQFEDLMLGLRSIAFVELRKTSDDYFEAVVVKENLAQLTAQLENHFGSPVWPSREALPSRIKAAIKDFGGVVSGQTLYFRNEASNTVFAMLWPWQDGKHTTVKIVKK